MLEGFYPATAMPDPDWWQTLWPDPEGVVRKFGVTPGMAVVDLCCGDGLFTVALAVIARNRVYAIDIDPEMLDRAQAAVQAARAPGCQFIQGDATDLVRLVPEPVDCIFHANTFHGVPDKTGLARAAATLLKPGGRFVVVNWYPLPHEQTTVLGQPRGPKTELRMAPSDVTAAVEPADLWAAEVVDLPPYHYGAVFVKPAAD
jgi:SAM-dependent methyltransferase